MIIFLIRKVNLTITFGSSGLKHVLDIKICFHLILFSMKKAKILLNLWKTCVQIIFALFFSINSNLGHEDFDIELLESHFDTITQTQIKKIQRKIFLHVVERIVEEKTNNDFFYGEIMH